MVMMTVGVLMVGEWGGGDECDNIMCDAKE